MTIDVLPVAPSPNDSAADFNDKAFAFLAALQTFRTQANGTALDVQNNADITAALALAMALPNYGDTSTTSLAIGTGSKTFTVSAGKSWVPGQIVVASSGGSFMKGTVTSYGGTSLVVNVTTVQGSGTFASWSIGLSYSGLGFAASGANSDITSLAGLTTPIPRSAISRFIESLTDPTLAGNAMTLPASTHTLDFRSATSGTGAVTTVSGTAAALVIPAGASIGMGNGVQGAIAEVIMNNGGTLEKAVVNLAGGNDLSEEGVISTTAISAGSIAANVFYSTTARSNLAYRVVRKIVSTQATAGQWATPPSLVQGAGGNALTSMQSAGYGQTVQSFTVGSTRALGTTYYNTTGKEIKVNLTWDSVSTGTSTITVGGVLLATLFTQSVLSAHKYFATFAVPAWQSYVVSPGASIFGWTENR